MSRRRFYAPPGAFSPGGQTVTLSSGETHHLRDVLGLRSGDEAYVFDGRGKEYRSIVRVFANGAAELEVTEEVVPAQPESSLQLTLALALLKGDKFDLVVQKATELGVTRIVAVTTKRGDVRPRDSQHERKRVERWRSIARDAAKQSGRALIPEILGILDCPSVITGTAGVTPGTRLMFSEGGGRPVADAIGGVDSASRTITALVGSEGGWTAEEIDQAREAGWEIVTLGGRTLRAETAAIVVLALLQHRLGDLA